MRILTVPLVSLAFLFSAVPSEARPMRNFKVGEWYAGAYSSDTTGQFNHCAASATYRSGILVLFSIDKNFRWSMGFAHPDWQLRPGTVYDVAFTVDDLTPIAAKAVAITHTQIRVQLADSVELFSHFKRGYVLRVAAARRVFSFNLTGTSRVLPALLTCAQNRGASPRPPSSNPFENQKHAVDSRSPEDANVKAEAAVMAANLLSTAGLTKFTMLEPNEHPDIKGHARWFQGSTFGTINVFPKFTAGELKEIPGYLISIDAKRCTGTFFSGAIPDESNSAVARVFTTCQKGEKPVTVYYLAIPRKAGGAYVISTISLGSEKPAKEQDTLLRSAVFKLNGKSDSSLQN